MKLLLFLTLFFSYYFLCSTTPLIFGMGFLGGGFDVTTMKHKVLPLYQINTTVIENAPKCYPLGSCGPCVWTDPLEKSKTHFIPSDVCVTEVDEYIASNGTFIFQSITDVSSYYCKITTSEDSSWWGSTATKSTTVQNQQEQYYENDLAMIYQWIELQRYSLELVTLLIPPHPLFVKAVSLLPPYDPNVSSSVEIYRRWISYFGTHVVTNANFGGMQKLFSYFHKCFLYSYSESYVKEQTNYDYLIGSEESGYEYYYSKLDETWKEYSSYQITYIGGYPFAFTPSDVNDWKKTVKDNPIPVSYQLRPIDQVVMHFNPKIAAEIKKAVTDYLNQSKTAAEQYSDKLKAMDPKDMPSWCTTPYDCRK